MYSQSVLRQLSFNLKTTHNVLRRSSTDGLVLNLTSARAYYHHPSPSGARHPFSLGIKPWDRSRLARLVRHHIITVFSSSSSNLRSVSSSRDRHHLGYRSMSISPHQSSSDPWVDHVDVHFQELKPITEMPSDDILLIDVREESEVIEGSIPSSVNIPISKFEKAIDLHPDDFFKTFGFSKPKTNQRIILYCRAGSRSAKALEIAKLKGFKNLRNYRGSWLDWIENQKSHWHLDWIKQSPLFLNLFLYEALIQNQSSLYSWDYPFHENVKVNQNCLEFTGWWQNLHVSLGRMFSLCLALE